MKSFKQLLMASLLLLPASFLRAGVADSVVLQTASNHPMQYYISLPDGWSKDRKWPVVVVIEAADKQYKENALRFVRARKKMPFIIVAPYNVNNSRSGRRDPTVFPYTPATWDFIEKVGDCQFNMDGLTEIMKDVQTKYSGEQKYYLTGFEAGTHTVWQMVFQHPERLKAAVAVAGNYNQNSCMSDPSSFSKDASAANLPVVGFSPQLDPYFGPAGVLRAQWLAAQKAAIDHGFRNVKEVVVPSKEHAPMPDEVMNYFLELLINEKKK